MLLQKRAIGITLVHNIGTGDSKHHTSKPFVKSRLLKLKEMEELKMFVMFRAKNTLMPANLQRFYVFVLQDDNTEGDLIPNITFQGLTENNCVLEKEVDKCVF